MSGLLCQVADHALGYHIRLDAQAGRGRILPHDYSDEAAVLWNQGDQPVEQRKDPLPLENDDIKNIIDPGLSNPA